ncbi:MAG TPA: DNA polymerase I [Candidatus Dojkabacteria bacterium]|nr:DNA polymerase I [Candidatus Dojkabacteria bacterium]HRP51494.1 DNA polymerase I [Candidatus Dojkabacteria bacterium]
MGNNLVLLIDSNAIIHRAYHAYPKTLVTTKGLQVNATFGFFSIVLQVLDKFKPDQVFFAFDSKEKTFRHKMFPEYKATRKKTDPELIEQFTLIKEILSESNITVLEKDGYEADDIIGTISRSKELEGKEKIIVTGDGDLLQLINDEVKVFLSGSAFQKSALYDSKTAEKKLGYTISQIIEYKGLRGDASDNIPGVKGIGEVSAKKLLSKYKTIESIFENLDEIENTVKKKLTASSGIALLSKQLASIDTNVPIEVDFTNHAISGYKIDVLRERFVSLEFHSLIARLSRLAVKKEVVKPVLKTQQSSLFGVDKQVVEDAGEIVLNEQKSTTIPNMTNRLFIQIVKSDEESYTALNIYDENIGKIFLKINDDDYKNTLKRIEENNLEVIIYNSKDLHLFHLEKGIRQININFDIKIAAHLLDFSNSKLSLSDLFVKYLGLSINATDVKESIILMKNLFEALKEKIEELKTTDWDIYKLFKEVEMPLSPVLAKMQITGIKLDIDYLNKFEMKISQIIDEKVKRIYELAGEEFNIASPKQLGEVLFGRMKLPGAKKSKNGSFSTNEKILINLKNTYPIVKEILDYRQLSKLKSTYTSSLVAEVNEKTGRIHSKFHQDVTTTGRLSSTEPNLQNIPISSDLGQEVRRAFVAEDGRKFVFFDYSQQELRLLAHLSGEPKLVDAFTNNIDIHALTASQVLNKPIEEITKEERRAGKTINFGIVYGISSYGLSERLDIDNGTAQNYINGFFETYPKVRVYFDELIKSAKMDGYVTTLLGRRKDTSGLDSPNFQIRRATEREVLNFPLQGSAADMIKVAMIKADKIIEEKYKDFAKMVLQIHDELVFEVLDEKDDNRLMNFAKDISKMMLEVFRLKVNMDVDVEVGKNLADSDNLLID